MKKLKLLVINGAVLAAAVINTSAQTTNVTINPSGGMTTTITITGNPFDEPLPAPSPSAPSLSGGLTEALASVGLVADPTNYAGFVFYGRSLKGNQSAIGLGVIEDVNNYVGVAAGLDTLRGGGKTDSANIVAGGFSLKLPSHPLKFMSSDTNSWFQTFTATTFGLALVGTPVNGTSNNGGLAAINRVGENLDLFKFKRLQLGLGIDYGNRTGAGKYSGNWADVSLNGRLGF
jgi:hypothetical protein